MNHQNLTYYIRRSFLFFVLIGICSSCAFKRITRTKNIEYLKADAARHILAQKLNVFSPRKPDSKREVLIFIHGGNWNSGRKGLYNFFGSRFARKGIVMVIIDYPLSPEATYKEMALAAAAAVKWTKENIARYGGDPEQIFVSGHSAGGHLAALISVDNLYFDTLHVSNPIKGAILIDAAGLDMYTYLKQQGRAVSSTYLQTFTTDPVVWKKASPVYFLHQNMPPFLVFQGGKTYPSITQTNETFMKKIQPFAPATKRYIQKGKHHVPMITQFLNPWNPRYKDILEFMKQ